MEMNLWKLDNFQKMYTDHLQLRNPAKTFLLVAFDCKYVAYYQRQES